MFNLSNQSVAVETSQFITPGKVEVRVNSLSVKTSKSGKKTLSVVLVGRPPYEGYKGALLDRNNKEGGYYDAPMVQMTPGMWIDAEAYNSSDVKKNSILNYVLYIVDSIKRRDVLELDVLKSAGSIEEYVEEIGRAINDTYFWILLRGKEEANDETGKVYTKCFFYANQSISLDPANLDDYNPEVHFKKLVAKTKTEEVSSFEAPTSDFNL